LRLFKSILAVFILLAALWGALFSVSEMRLSEKLGEVTAKAAEKATEKATEKNPDTISPPKSERGFYSKAEKSSAEPRWVAMGPAELSVWPSQTKVQYESVLEADPQAILYARVRTTSDGVPVLFAPDSLEAISGKKEFVFNYDYEEFRQQPGLSTILTVEEFNEIFGASEAVFELMDSHLQTLKLLESVLAKRHSDVRFWVTSPHARTAEEVSHTLGPSKLVIPTDKLKLLRMLDTLMLSGLLNIEGYAITSPLREGKVQLVTDSVLSSLARRGIAWWARVDSNAEYETARDLGAKAIMSREKFGNLAK